MFCLTPLPLPRLPLALAHLIRIPNPAQKYRQHGPDPQPRQQRHKPPPHPIPKRIPYHVLYSAGQPIKTRHRREPAAVEQRHERSEIRRGERVDEVLDLRTDVRVDFGVEDGEALRETNRASECAELERGEGEGECVCACALRETHKEQHGVGYGDMVGFREARMDH